MKVVRVVGFLYCAIDGGEWGQISEERRLGSLWLGFLGGLESLRRFWLLGISYFLWLSAFSILLCGHH